MRAGPAPAALPTRRATLLRTPFLTASDPAPSAAVPRCTPSESGRIAPSDPPADATGTPLSLRRRSGSLCFRNSSSKLARAFSPLARPRPSHGSKKRMQLYTSAAATATAHALGSTVCSIASAIATASPSPSPTIRRGHRITTRSSTASAAKSARTGPDAHSSAGSRSSTTSALPLPRPASP